MIDIHSHVLPGMDDGANDLEEASKLIETLKSQGVFILVFTPHYYPGREQLEFFIKRRERAFEAIKQNDIIKKNEIKTRLGSETFMSEALFKYDDISALCIDGTNYLLLELPFVKKWENKEFLMIERIMANFGVRPIIAHIEKYEPICHWFSRQENLTRLIEMGCLLQINIDSVIDKNTRSTALKLIKNKWADFVGSDCHNLTTRAPQFEKFIEIINFKLGLEFLDAFDKNAREILLKDSKYI